MPGIELLPGPSSNHTYIRDYHMAMVKRRLFDDTLKLIAVSTWRRHQMKQLQGISVSTPKGFGSGVAKRKSCLINLMASHITCLLKRHLKFFK